MSVLPGVERRDRDQVRTLGGQIGDEGDISELDQRVRYICMLMWVRLVVKVGSALDVVYHTWGNSSGQFFLGFSICNQAGHSWFAYKKMFAPLPVHQLSRSAALPEQARRVAEKELKVGSC